MPAQLRVLEPSILNRSVTPGAPGRPSNASLRPREYLTEAEIEQLMKAARDGRYGRRDATLILIAFRHGLRATEIADLEWSQVELGPRGFVACSTGKKWQARGSSYTW